MLVSESDPDPFPGGLFSSKMTLRDRGGLTLSVGTREGGDKLPVLPTSSDRSGGVRAASGELEPRRRLKEGATGDPSGTVESLAVLDRNPAENLPGLAAGRIEVSDASKLLSGSSTTVTGSEIEDSSR